jgi:NADPH:quinone reductase-like Zn-dependent oxidoreductase
MGNAANGPEGHMCGGLAEEALIRSDTALRIPGGMADEEALVMHENYWDVHHAISTCGKIQHGDTLLVLGASGACGMAAIGTVATCPNLLYVTLAYFVQTLEKR